jgi:hypothetical protein
MGFAIAVHNDLNISCLVVNHTSTLLINNRDSLNNTGKTKEPRGNNMKDNARYMDRLYSSEGKKLSSIFLD